MNIKEDIKPISYIKTHAADILKKINENHRPIIITQNGEAKGVFVDTESYQKMKDTISLMKLLVLSENDTYNLVEQDTVFDNIKNKLDKIKNEI